MKQLQSLSHTVWECKYHIVWIPKYRKKVLYGQMREDVHLRHPAVTLRNMQRRATTSRLLAEAVIDPDKGPM